MSLTNTLKSIAKSNAAVSLVVLASLVSACGGGGGGSSGGTAPPPAQSFTIGGTVTGLTGTGLTLQNNGGNSLQVAAGATSFVFSTAVATGGAYAVTVSAQPSSPAQACTVSNGSGSVGTSNVSNVSITCVTGAVLVGGTISGLTGSGLVLQDNGGDNLMVAANATTFTFATPVNTGAGYAVTVATPPSSPAETCTVTGGSGTASTTDVTTVSIVCSSVTATVGGTITGLGGSGLVLQDNGADNLSVAANATTFTFATPVSEGAPFNVTVLTQPSTPLETCTVTGGSGTASASNITSVVVACVPATFSVGGSITGLTGSGLVLQDNAGDNLSLAANASTFTFAAPLPVGTGYAVTVAVQPTNPVQTCAVVNGSGTIVASNVSNVTVSCASVGRFVFVANSSDNGAPGDVSAFTIDSTTGALTALAGGPVHADGGANGIVVDHTGQFVYASNKTTGDVSFYTIASSGALSFQQNFPTAGVAEASIAITPSNQYVYVGGASGVYGFSLNASSGVLSAVPTPRLATLDSLTSLAIDPTSQLVFGATNGSNAVYAFGIGTGGTLSQLTRTQFDGRSGGIAVYPAGGASGGYVYTTDNLILRVSGLAYDSVGNLTELLNSPYNTFGRGPQGIAVDPAGTYVYVTNYLDGNITSFSINAQTKALTRIGSPVNTGNLNNVANPGPIDVKVDPSNQFVYVVNSLDGSISAFTAAAGVLTLVNTVSTGTGAGTAVGAAAAVF